MSLKLRPTGLSSGADKDREDYAVFCGEWNIGHIYEVRGGPEHLRWFWALHFPSKPENLRTDNRVATLDVAKAEFEASWRQWKSGRLWPGRTICSCSRQEVPPSTK